MICENCGKTVEPNRVVFSLKNGGGISTYCTDCSSLFGTCHTCKNRKGCGFFNDPDPMPKYIVIQQKTQHTNGYSIVQRQVPNTERLRKFCLDGKCVCCDETDPKDPFCSRFYTTCINYCEEDDEKIVENFPIQDTSEN